MDRADVAIAGAGAAGLMAAVWARRTAPAARVVLLDGAQKLGAKILIAGGGRCNVTHERVDADAFAGSSRYAIRKVLRRFDVSQTVAFFKSCGVALKREETGKLFPTTDRAKSVLDALLRLVRESGVDLIHPRRVESISPSARGFIVAGEWGALDARRVVLATGGKSVPNTGSDGHGYEIARNLGHTVTPLFPALVPLILPRDHFARGLSGISTETTLDVVTSAGKKLARFTGPVLCAHFGLSGPAVLDISRYYIDAVRSDPGVGLVINWFPGRTPASLEREFLDIGPATVSHFLERSLPDRLAAALCAAAGVDPGTKGHEITRERRGSLASVCTRMRLPVTGDRGFDYAEVTAGGVPLAELRLDTMESRIRPGLHICGEICDVDGRIGGFNFQWAWASGYTAGVSAGRAVQDGC
jgi:predicted Rossmann fold flavoprotein